MFRGSFFYYHHPQSTCTSHYPYTLSTHKSHKITPTRQLSVLSQVDVVFKQPGRPFVAQSSACEGMFVLSSLLGTLMTHPFMTFSPQNSAIGNLAAKYSYQGHQVNGSQQFGSSSSSFSPSVVRDGGVSAPPTQSRDATSRSRYFPITNQATSENGTILVPNSSPLSQRYSTEYSSPQQSSINPVGPGFVYPHHGAYNGFSGQHLNPGWVHHGNFNTNDPLSRPSGFITSSSSSSSTSSNAIYHASNAPQRHPYAVPTHGRPSVRRTIDDEEDSGSERPRKRLSRRQTPDTENNGVILVGDSSPEREVDAASPAIVRMGQKRRVNAGRRVDSPTPSEDSFPTDGAGPSKPRLVKQALLPPTSPPVSSQLPPGVQEDIRISAMTYPTYHPSVVAAIYKECRFDKKKAELLLSDNSYMQQHLANQNTVTIQSSPPRPVPAVVGRVMEVDEERERARAAEREKAAKSAIYRRRAEMDNLPKLSTPPAAPPVMLVPDTPDSPVVMRRARPKVKRVVDSGSEGESDESSRSLSTIPKPKAGSYRDRALHSFNSLDADALRELTGMFF